jgi:hypothetical protein
LVTSFLELRSSSASPDGTNPAFYDENVCGQLSVQRKERLSVTAPPEGWTYGQDDNTQPAQQCRPPNGAPLSLPQPTLQFHENQLSTMRAKRQISQMTGIKEVGIIRG